MTFMPFSATTRMSGVNTGDYEVRRVPATRVLAWVRQQGGATPMDLDAAIQRVAGEGGTPGRREGDGQQGERVCSASRTSRTS
jgi:K+-transporting ATPase ATPase B chain